MANKNGHWYTDKNGHHYFVEDGQSPKEGWEASKRRKMIDGGKYKVSDDGNTYNEVSKDEYDKFEADDADWDMNNDDDFGFDEEEENQRYREAEYAMDGEEGHDYELDALRERHEKGLDNDEGWAPEDDGYMKGQMFYDGEHAYKITDVNDEEIEFINEKGQKKVAPLEEFRSMVESDEYDTHGVTKEEADALGLDLDNWNELDEAQRLKEAKEKTDKEFPEQGDREKEAEIHNLLEKEKPEHVGKYKAGQEVEYNGKKYKVVTNRGYDKEFNQDNLVLRPAEETEGMKQYGQNYEDIQIGSNDLEYESRGGYKALKDYEDQKKKEADNPLDPNNPKYKDFKSSDITNAELVDEGEEYDDFDSGKKRKQSIIKYIPYGALRDGDKRELYGIVDNYDGSDTFKGGAIVSPSLEDAREQLKRQIQLGIQGSDRYLKRGKYDEDYFNVIRDNREEGDDEKYKERYGWDFNKPFAEHDFMKDDPYLKYQQSKQKQTGTEAFDNLKKYVNGLSDAEKEMLKDLLNNPRK